MIEFYLINSAKMSLKSICDAKLAIKKFAKFLTNHNRSQIDEHNFLYRSLHHLFLRDSEFSSLSISFSLFFTFLFSASNNFKGLLLRSHVLHRLKHYQSSLADVDNAIKTRPFSYKVSVFFLLFLLLPTIKKKFGDWKRRNYYAKQKIQIIHKFSSFYTPQHSINMERHLNKSHQRDSLLNFSWKNSHLIQRRNTSLRPRFLPFFIYFLLQWLNGRCF